MTAAEIRRRRRDDETAYALWCLCWRIKAVHLGDTGPMPRPSPSTGETEA